MRPALYILGQMTDHDLGWLVQVGRRRAADRGEAFIEEGEVKDTIFVVLEGRIGFERANKRRATAGAGEAFGALCLGPPPPAAATVVAAEPTSVLEIPRSAVSDRLAEDARFARRVFQALTFYFGDQCARLDDDAGSLDPGALEAVEGAGVRFERLVAELRVRTRQP